MANQTDANEGKRSRKGYLDDAKEEAKRNHPVDAKEETRRNINNNQGMYVPSVC